MEGSNNLEDQRGPEPDSPEPSRPEKVIAAASQAGSTAMAEVAGQGATRNEVIGDMYEQQDHMGG